MGGKRTTKSSRSLSVLTSCGSTPTKQLNLQELQHDNHRNNKHKLEKGEQLYTNHRTPRNLTKVTNPSPQSPSPSGTSVKSDHPSGVPRAVPGVRNNSFSSSRRVLRHEIKRRASMASVVLKSLSILLGIFFIFVGTTKLTPRVSKELYKDLVSNVVIWTRVRVFR